MEVQRELGEKAEKAGSLFLRQSVNGLFLLFWGVHFLHGVLGDQFLSFGIGEDEV